MDAIKQILLPVSHTAVGPECPPGIFPYGKPVFRPADTVGDEIVRNTGHVVNHGVEQSDHAFRIRFQALEKHGVGQENLVMALRDIRVVQAALGDCQ
ncbi:hypothetical protein [Devosia sp. Naph2]|uniref:hypothetical protein n=1 Tax=Devosia polycyclovorans TaxID=3345148 RepID=UPI0035D04AD6